MFRPATSKWKKCFSVKTFSSRLIIPWEISFSLSRPKTLPNSLRPIQQTRVCVKLETIIFLNCSVQLALLIKWVWITCLSWRELENDEISSIEHLSAYLSTPPWDILLSLWRTIYKSFRFWKVETVLSISGTFSRPHQQTLWKLVEFLNEWIVRGRNWQVCWHIMEQEIGFFGLLDTATCWIAYKRVGGWIFAAHTQKGDSRWSWKSSPPVFLPLPPHLRSRHLRRVAPTQEKGSGSIFTYTSISDIHINTWF